MGRYSTDKDVQRVVADLVRRGWRFESGRKHKKVFPPNSGRFVAFSASPSCHHALEQFSRDIKRLEKEINHA
jgi:hypothetical protein